jgi:hypothetical protein
MKMNAKEFFKLTKFKIICLVVIALIIIISGLLTPAIPTCDPVHCKLSAIIVINDIHDALVFYIHPTHSILPFIISMFLYYLIISIIVFGYKYLRKKEK